MSRYLHLRLFENSLEILISTLVNMFIVTEQRHVNTITTHRNRNINQRTYLKKYNQFNNEICFVMFDVKM